jgi:hypothetical protein
MSHNNTIEEDRSVATVASDESDDYDASSFTTTGKPSFVEQSAEIARAATKKKEHKENKEKKEKKTQIHCVPNDEKSKSSSTDTSSVPSGVSLEQNPGVLSASGIITGGKFDILGNASDTEPETTSSSSINESSSAASEFKVVQKRKKGKKYTPKEYRAVAEAIQDSFCPVPKDLSSTDYFSTELSMFSATEEVKQKAIDDLLQYIFADQEGIVKNIIKAFRDGKDLIVLTKFSNKLRVTVDGDICEDKVGFPVLSLLTGKGLSKGARKIKSACGIILEQFRDLLIKCSGNTDMPGVYCTAFEENNMISITLTFGGAGYNAKSLAIFKKSITPA